MHDFCKIKCNPNRISFTINTYYYINLLAINLFGIQYKTPKIKYFKNIKFNGRSRFTLF